MPTNVPRLPNRREQTILQILRWTVALQCVGNWRWLTQIQETPLLSWMLNAPDIGGLGWSEATASAIQSGLGWLLLPAALILIWKSHPLVLLLPITFQVANTVAMWQIAGGYSLLADWLPFDVLTLFPFATQLLRIGGAVGLAMLCWKQEDSQGSSVRFARTMEFLRWAAVIVYVAHGVEALQHNPEFLDLVVYSTYRVFGAEISESFAATSLTVIGTVDVLVGLICVFARSKWAMSWMAVWGAVTALSRVVAFGWAIGWHASLARAPHCGVPLAVALWWFLLESKATDSSEENSGGMKNA